MAITLKASKEGLRLIDDARRKKGWAKSAKVWQDLAFTSKSTLKRFWNGAAIQTETFIAICKAVNVDWQLVVDKPRTNEEAYQFNSSFSHPLNALDKSSQAECTRRKEAQSFETLWIVPFRRNQFFCGRDDVVQHLRQSFDHAQLSSDPVVEALSGLGGVGKTQVAVEYAYRYRTEYTAILWVQAATEASQGLSFQAIAQALKLPNRQEQSINETIAAVHNWLTQNLGWLLVFDNVEQPEKIRLLLPKWGQGHILVTARTPRFDSLGLAQPVHLNPLSTEEAVAFLRKRTGRSLDDTEEMATATAIAIELGGLPLALEQAAAYIVEQQISFQDYLVSFRQRQLELLQRSRPVTGEYSESVATTWSLNFQSVEESVPAAADLLRISAFLAPDSIPYKLFENGHKVLTAPLQVVLAGAAADPGCVPELLAPLNQFSLVKIEPSARMYSVHRLVQEAVKNTSFMDEATCQQWAIQTVEMVATAFPAAEFEHWEQCDRLLPHVLVCQYWIEHYSYQSTGAAQLLHNAGCYLRRQGRFPEAESLLEGAVAMRRALLGELALDVATSLHALGSLNRAQGKYSAAEQALEAALAIRQELLPVEHVEIATTLNNLGLLYQYQGRYQEAETLQQEAIAMCTRLYGETGEDLANSLNDLGLLYLEHQHKYDAAEQLFKRVYAIYRQLTTDTHTPDMATTLNNLALVYQAQGRFQEADSTMQAALTSYRTLFGEQHPAVATAINNIARLHTATGDYASAQTLCEQALNLRRKLLGEQHPDVLSSCRDLAELYVLQGREADAANLLQQVLELREQVLGSDHPITVSTRDALVALREQYPGN